MLESLLDPIYNAASSSSINWRLVLVTGAVFDFGFRTYLDYRQFRVQLRKSPPADAVKENLVDESTFKRSQEYSRTKLAFGVLKRFVGQAINLWMLQHNVLPQVWQTWMAKVAPVSWAGEKVAGIATMLTLSLVALVWELPLDYYRTFVIEEKFGFNKFTHGLWIKDQVKQVLLSLALTPLVMGGVQAIIAYFGRQFIPYLMLFILFVILVANVLFPMVIDPWFHKYQQLEDGELRTAIEKLAESLSFPLGSIWVIDSSSRSSHSNAYFVGFPWYKQIVIYDTLIKDQSTDEIVAVLAHELGHWKRNHMTIQVGVAMGTVLAEFGPLALFLDNGHFFESIGFARGQTPVVGALLAYADVLSPMRAVVEFGRNTVTRLCEYDADRFATKRGKGRDLRKALVALNKSNLSNVESDSLYSTFHNSHPILLERLRAIGAEIKKLE